MARLPEADIVYAWGVLHHTGDMYEAITNAAAKVRPGGLFFLALYRKTILCRAWKIEKRFYSGASDRTRAIIRAAWIAKTRLAFLLKRKDFDGMVASYEAGRAMDYYRDMDDWLGGFPYESITPPECRAFLGALGFSLIKERVLTDGVSIAISSGCDEWVFRRER
jgi:2-polyprenyl-6-hydroxyphenyl methylase/3-demethylubiquinone-9 3-methyltransferase